VALDGLEDYLRDTPANKITSRENFRSVYNACGNPKGSSEFLSNASARKGYAMGRYLLLWLLGIPLPILLLIWVFGGLH
jgi:hypothetical protein